jgi:hypothetical protein
VNELHEELDRALRAVPLRDAPVERARRDGRRLRTRRRVAALAGMLAVVAVAVGIPTLTGNSAVGGVTPEVSSSGTGGPNPRLTAGPPVGAVQAPGGLTSTNGVVATGTAGPVGWRVSVSATAKESSCYKFSFTGATGPRAPTSPDAACIPAAQVRSIGAGGNAPPAAFDVSEPGLDAVVGVAASNVTYLIVTFADGQQLKLIPVTAAGHRFFAWVAPETVPIASVTAHLGAPYNDSGQTATTIPFTHGTMLPWFGLWQRPGQAPPPRAHKVLATGKGWTISADEGPWGTCFINSSAFAMAQCTAVAKLSATAMFGGWAGGGTMSTGSAGPGVARIRLTAGKAVSGEAIPVTVGNERLVVIATSGNVQPDSWTAYDAHGQVVASGSPAPNYPGT